MDIKNIRYLFAIEELKSISAAAKRLYISQPTLSQEIRGRPGISHFYPHQTGVEADPGRGRLLGHGPGNSAAGAGHEKPSGGSGRGCFRLRDLRRLSPESPLPHASGSAGILPEISPGDSGDLGGPDQGSGGKTAKGDHRPGHPGASPVGLRHLLRGLYG